MLFFKKEWKTLEIVNVMSNYKKQFPLNNFKHIQQFKATIIYIVGF